MAKDLEEPVAVLEARTVALEMIVVRLVAQRAVEWEEPRRAANRLIADLLTEAHSSGSDLVAAQLRRFGQTLDDRLSREADPI